MATHVEIRQPNGAADFATLIDPMTVEQYAELVAQAGITVVRWWTDEFETPAPTDDPGANGAESESSLPWWAWLAGGYVVFRLLR